MQALERPSDAHAAALHATALAEFVQSSIRSFGEFLQEERFLVHTDDALPTTPMRQGFDGARFASLAQQVLQPSFRYLKAFGKLRLGSFLGNI